MDEHCYSPADVADDLVAGMVHKNPKGGRSAGAGGVCKQCGRAPSRGGCWMARRVVEHGAWHV